jgi:thiol-disulfide isomerase/thioredoxin
LKLLPSTCLSLFILTCLLLPLTVASGELEPYTETDQPGFSLPDLKDKTHHMSDYQGKVVLVNFWASWCPPCIYEMPELTRLKQQLADRPFEILALNVGEKKYRVRKFTKLINFELPVLLDTRNDTFNNWGVKTLPTSFLIDGNGKIRYGVRGNPGWEHEDSVALIEKLIAETAKTVTLNQTTSNEDSQ